MQRKRLSEEQIMRIVREAEALGNVRDVCRQHHTGSAVLCSFPHLINMLRSHLYVLL